MMTTSFCTGDEQGERDQASEELIGRNCATIAPFGCFINTRAGEAAVGNQGASFLERGIPQTCSEAVADAKPRNPSRSIKRRFPHAAQATRDMVQ